MITKEELLQKGISDELADEIIAGFESDTEEENSLLALQKALGDDAEMGSLFKADDNEEDDEGDDEDYDEKYMKKYMKRYMKSNGKSCQKMMKEVGLYGENMKKAVDDIDLDTDGAVIEMTDLAPLLTTLVDGFDGLTKAVSDLAGQTEFISDKTDKAFDLMKKAATVQVEQAKGLNDFLSIPNGRKGVTANATMTKATDLSAGFTKEDNKIIYQTLLKAVKSGNQTAGQVISAFESHGQNANKLNKVQKEFIHEIISQEAN